MHTILGAGGPIANELIRQLSGNHLPVRLVSRSKRTHGSPSVTWQGADLLDRTAVTKVTAGSEVIYLTAGLAYDHRIWGAQWPVIMENVIAAAQTHGARLLFFDNVYMYGLMEKPVTEDTPYRPISKKGAIRARIADTLMDAIATGRVKGAIARAPDFYGVDSNNSFLDSMVINRVAAGQRPLWVGDRDKLHNFIYVPDAGRGLFLLGQHPEHDGQIWHLPTPDPVSGHHMLDLISQTFDFGKGAIPVKKWMLRLLGPFDPAVKGTVEMYYQYDHDYRFDSSRFQRVLGQRPTPYREALAVIRDRIQAEKPIQALSVPG